jgi:hypothetical protein
MPSSKGNTIKHNALEIKKQTTYDIDNIINIYHPEGKNYDELISFIKNILEFIQFLNLKSSKINRYNQAVKSYIKIAEQEEEKQDGGGLGLKTIKRLRNGVKILRNIDIIPLTGILFDGIIHLLNILEKAHHINKEDEAIASYYTEIKNKLQSLNLNFISIIDKHNHFNHGHTDDLGHTIDRTETIEDAFILSKCDTTSLKTNIDIIKYIYSFYNDINGYFIPFMIYLLFCVKIVNKSESSSNNDNNDNDNAILFKDWIIKDNLQLDKLNDYEFYLYHNDDYFEREDIYDNSKKIPITTINVNYKNIFDNKKNVSMETTSKPSTSGGGYIINKINNKKTKNRKKYINTKTKKVKNVNKTLLTKQRITKNIKKYETKKNIKIKNKTKKLSKHKQKGGDDETEKINSLKPTLENYNAFLKLLNICNVESERKVTQGPKIKYLKIEDSFKHRLKSFLSNDARQKQFRQFVNNLLVYYEEFPDTTSPTSEYTGINFVYLYTYLNDLSKVKQNNFTAINEKKTSLKGQISEYVKNIIGYKVTINNYTYYRNQNLLYKQLTEGVSDTIQSVDSQVFIKLNEPLDDKNIINSVSSKGIFIKKQTDRKQITKYSLIAETWLNTVVSDFVNYKDIKNIYLQGENEINTIATIPGDTITNFGKYYNADYNIPELKTKQSEQTKQKFIDTPIPYTNITTALELLYLLFIPTREEISGNYSKHTDGIQTYISSIITGHQKSLNLEELLYERSAKGEHCYEPRIDVRDESAGEEYLEIDGAGDVANAQNFSEPEPINVMTTKELIRTSTSSTNTSTSTNA